MSSKLCLLQSSTPPQSSAVLDQLGHTACDWLAQDGDSTYAPSQLGLPGSCVLRGVSGRAEGSGTTVMQRQPQAHKQGRAKCGYKHL